LNGRGQRDRGETLLVMSLLLGALTASVALGQSQEGNPHPRVITLEPSLTETVCALDACGWLIATDRYSDSPESVQALPKVGSSQDAQIEAIVRLRPDLVFIRRAPKVVDRLRGLGITAISVNTRTYRDIAQTIVIVADALGIPERAQMINASIEREMAQVSAQRKSRGIGPTVYFEVDRGSAAAGESSFIGEMLLRLGARNIVAAELGPFPRLNPEYVVRHDPDVMFVAPIDVPRLAERPGWSQLRAVKDNRICAFPTEVRDVIVRPGPRIAEGMRAMADCLDRMWPELQ
jgi:iron complex transport system substrate-binding protein